jgi:hypothetical protein
MFPMLQRLCALSMLAALLCACEESPLYDPRGDWLTSNYSGTIEFSHSLRIHRDRARRYDVVRARFSDFDSHGLYAGEVRFNGRALRIEPAFVRLVDDTTKTGMGYEATSALDGVAIPLDGSALRVSASGGRHIPAFTDSIASLDGELAAIAPADGDTVSRREGFVVAWKPSSDPRAQIEITVVSLDTTEAEPAVGASIHLTELADNGRFVITSALLASYPPGQLFVAITRRASRPVAIGGNRRVLLSIASDVVARGTLVR